MCKELLGHNTSPWIRVTHTFAPNPINPMYQPVGRQKLAHGVSRGYTCNR